MIQNEFRKQSEKVESIRRDIERTEAASAPNAGDPEREVENALALLDNIKRVVTDPKSRDDVPGLLRQIDLRMGLTFTEGRKGPKRKIRVLKSGFMTTGGKPLPVAMYGKDAIRPDEFDGGRSSSAKKCQREAISFPKGNRGEKI